MCLLAPVAAAAAMEDTEEEELQEADVVWPSHDHAHHSPDGERRRHQQPQRWRGKKRLPCCPCIDGGSGARRRPPGSSSSSAPVAIAVPVGVDVAAARWPDQNDEDAAFVPPHVVLAARRRCWEAEGRAAASVCVGLGRTLKGRDLQSVRTAVLRMTGFIET